jgi:uncharacterized membrane protein YccF (DUF307 family)
LYNILVTKKTQKEKNMKTLGNIIWFLLFGLWMGLGWFVSGIIFCVTLIGIPFGKACFRVCKLIFLPFGKTVTTDYNSHPKGNTIWMVLGGAYSAVSFALLGGLLCITIIGIPFAKQFFKLARLAAVPFGATVEK